MLLLCVKVELSLSLGEESQEGRIWMYLALQVETRQWAQGPCFNETEPGHPNP